MNPTSNRTYSGANKAATGYPKAFGVFSPTGHVVVAFPPGTDLDAVEDQLAEHGFGADTVARLSATQMAAQADVDIATASPLAAIGQELNLVKAQRELATTGHDFLIVEAARDDQAAEVAEVAQQFNASRAQHYGRWLIEEMIPVGTTDRQVNESPDRGLDAQTMSGREHGTEN